MKKDREMKNIETGKRTRVDTQKHTQQHTTNSQQLGNKVGASKDLLAYFNLFITSILSRKGESDLPWGKGKEKTKKHDERKNILGAIVFDPYIDRHFFPLCR